MREAYPSIRYVIDLHRDAVFDEDGNAVRAVAPLNGAAAAQVGLSVGNGGYESWESALALALALAEDLNAGNRRIARTTVLDNSEKLGAAAGECILLHMEVGTAANSIGEAERAAEYVGEVLAELIARIEASAAEG
jgi:stage II sporulation protein P